MKSRGGPHKDKPIDKICTKTADTPDWFINGVHAAMLAPTAINQQKFHFSEKEGIVTATAGNGPCAKTDLGIVKYHFELAAGVENFTWA